MNPSTPEISIIMSVYNAGPYLERSLDSVLLQQDVSLELIVVDDGSTDESPQLVERRAAKDNRIRAFRHPNQGLTRSLIRGCSEAHGVYIARQDADDVSLPGRLRMQADLLGRDPSLALVGCWTRFVGPLGEGLGTWEPEPGATEATRALRCGDLTRLRSLIHGSAMFRRADYLRVGGYRPELYLAQDLDLWLRLTDVGMLALVPTVLYESRTSPSSISIRFRPLQVQMARIILELSRLRGRGGDEGPLLLEASKMKPGPWDVSSGRTELASGLYFIGKRLLDKRDPRAVDYLKRAILARPWHVKSYASLAQAVLVRAWHKGTPA